MRYLLVVLTVVVLAALEGSVGIQTARAEKVAARCPGIARGVKYYRTETLKLGVRSYRIEHKVIRSCSFGKWVAKLWRHRLRITQKLHVQRQAQAQAFNSLYSKWACIHSHEGAWNSNTGNGYYGGLQMDITFQTTYGPEFYARWGTADHWPVWAQLTAAERAYRTRGFYPWPNTARACGQL